MQSWLSYMFVLFVTHLRAIDPARVGELNPKPNLRVRLYVMGRMDFGEVYTDATGIKGTIFHIGLEIDPSHR